MKKCKIGGQAVLEGVMMKAPHRVAIAVRRSSGEVEVKSQEIVPLKEKYPILKFPILRGIVAFGETMVLGVKSLLDSAELYGEEESPDEYKPSKFEVFIAEKTGKDINDVVVFFALAMAIAFAVLLFVVMPAFLTSLIRGWVASDILMSGIEGIIRLATFLLYIVVISRLKDIQRVFEYHGAEHKTIHCYEHEEELTVENARKYTTLHPRCGTAFLLVVMVISIVMFSFLGWNNIFIRIGSKLLLLPVVAGISYEIIKWAGDSNSKLVGIVMYPGLMLQKLTTREPDDSQLEVAIRSFLAAAGEVKEELGNVTSPKNYTSNEEGTATAGGERGFGAQAGGRDSDGPSAGV